MAVAPEPMSPHEVAWGLVPGLLPPQPWPSPRGDARTVLELLAEEALRRPPCAAAFSGGRDSSALLALLTVVARSRGLPDPLPVTRRFPGVAATDEDAWQERVVRHLGLREWVRLDLTDELDLVGPVAGPALRRRGVRWPPMQHSLDPLLPVARGGALVVGEGGDEVFGAHRAAVLAQLRDRRRRLGRRSAPLVAEAAAPWPLRRRLVLRRLHAAAARRPWLTAAAREAFLEARLADERAEPLTWPAAVRHLRRLRGARSGHASVSATATEAGVAYRVPLLAPEFLAALAAGGRLAGPPGRSEAMAALFGDLLPAEILGRRSKATFGDIAFGRHSRAFAAVWDGGGLDPGLVDAVALRRAWQAPAPDPASHAALQAAWLATAGGASAKAG